MQQESTRSARSGISAIGTLTLVAIVAVLVFVSLPRLQGFALHENERDALDTVRILGQDLGQLEAETSLPTLEEWATELGVLRTLADAEFLEEGLLMRRHGYVFELARLPFDPTRALEPADPQVVEALYTEEGDPVVPRQPLLLAWPWKPGVSGNRVFVGTGEQLIFAHGGASSDDSGETRRPVRLLRTSAGWSATR